MSLVRDGAAARCALILSIVPGQCVQLTDENTTTAGDAVSATNLAQVVLSKDSTVFGAASTVLPIASSSAAVQENLFDKVVYMRLFHCAPDHGYFSCTFNQARIIIV